MKKILKTWLTYILILILTLFFINPDLAAQVYEPEIRGLGPVEFINYEGPHTRIETRAQIRGIGYDLGSFIRVGQIRAGGMGRYFVIHSVSAPDGSRLDADIFGLGTDAGVNHIRNLRFIIQGYLEGAYNYSERDASILAEYITIYNAVYRGDVRYLNTRYKDPVMEHITAERAGLSIRYDEWPGRTLMLIPLGLGIAGPLSLVDTGSLTDPEVTEQLRQQPDLGMDTRIGMIDLMERQAEEAEQEAAIQREAIREEEARIERERREAEQQRQEAEQARREAEQRRQEAEREQAQIAQERQDPAADQRALDERQREAEQAQREAEQARREAEQQRQEAEQQEQELARQEEQLETQRQQVEQIEQYAEERADDAQEERRILAEDQQTQITREVDSMPPPPQGILGASILSANNSLGRIVSLDPQSGQEIRRSVLNTVNIRSIAILGGRMLAIAGEARGDGAIRLVEINTQTLEMIKQGDDDISPESLLWVNGNDLYAITSTGGSLYLARFNTELVRQARSAVTVHPFASVVIMNNYLVTQRADGSALLLNLRDLTERL